MKRRTKVIAIAILATIIGIHEGYYYLNIPKYGDAIVHGTVQNSYEGCCYPGFGTTSFFNLNITLDPGTHGNMSVWHDNPYNTNGQSAQTGPVSVTGYPIKLSSGVWDYLVRVSCTYFKAGDSVYLRVPIYQGGNIWSEPKAVQGYD